MNLNRCGAVVGTGLIGGAIAIECFRAFDVSQNLPSSTVAIGLAVIGLTSFIASRILRPSQGQRPENTYALPPIFLFERHDDPTAGRVAFELLPKLKEVGYSVYCVEISDIYTTAEIIQKVKSHVKMYEQGRGVFIQIAEAMGVSESDLGKMNPENVENLISQFFENKRDAKTINTMRKYLDSFYLLGRLKQLLDTITKAQECGFSVIGIDDHEAREQYDMAEGPESKKNGPINQKREKKMARKIEQLCQEGKGVLYVCGNMHDFSLIEKCPGALSYLTISPGQEIIINKYCDGRYNNISKDYLQTLTEDEIPSFADKIVAQVIHKFTQKLADGRV